MSIQPSDLDALSERLLIACDQSYAGELLVVDESHLSPYFDAPLYRTMNRLTNLISQIMWCGMALPTRPLDSSA